VPDPELETEPERDRQELSVGGSFELRPPAPTTAAPVAPRVRAECFCSVLEVNGERVSEPKATTDTPVRAAVPPWSEATRRRL
jgi:hypothetical protein